MRSRRRVLSTSIVGVALVLAVTTSAWASRAEAHDKAVDVPLDVPVPVGLATNLIGDVDDPDRLFSRVCLGLSTVGVLASMAEMLIRAEIPAEVPVGDSGVAAYGRDLMVACAQLQAGQIPDAPLPVPPAIDPTGGSEPPSVPDPEGTLHDQWPTINGLTQDPGGTATLGCLLVPLVVPVVLAEAGAPAIPVNTNQVTGPLMPFCFTAAGVLSDPGGPHFVMVPHPAALAPAAVPGSIPWVDPVVTPELPIESPMPVTPPLPAPPDIPDLPSIPGV